MEDYKTKYEIAIKKAKEELKVCGSLDCDAARQIFRFFPELKESEDDRIKTNIIKLLRFVRNSYHQYSGECNESIAWLEKQAFVHSASNVELKFKEEAIKKIQEAANNGTEEGHYDGDKVLCDLLILLGYKEVVDEWNKLDKWYS